MTQITINLRPWRRQRDYQRGLRVMAVWLSGICLGVVGAYGVTMGLEVYEQTLEDRWQQREQQIEAARQQRSQATELRRQQKSRPVNLSLLHALRGLSAQLPRGGVLHSVTVKENNMVVCGRVHRSEDLQAIPRATMVSCTMDKQGAAFCFAQQIGRSDTV